MNFANLRLSLSQYQEWAQYHTYLADVAYKLERFGPTARLLMDDIQAYIRMDCKWGNQKINCSPHLEVAFRPYVSGDLQWIFFEVHHLNLICSHDEWYNIHCVQWIVTVEHDATFLPICCQATLYMMDTHWQNERFNSSHYVWIWLSFIQCLDSYLLSQLN